MLKKIAQKGYDVSYAANINFATYDIVTNVPGIVSFLSITIGILGLVFDSFRVVGVSVCILLLGILSLYIEKFSSNIEEYNKLGQINTGLLYKLKNLYYKVKDLEKEQDFIKEERIYEEIENEFNNISNSKQILFANWFAHYKMFVEKDYRWMDEQLHFGWWKDKIPGTAKVVILILFTIGIIFLILNWCNVWGVISGWFTCKQ